MTLIAIEINEPTDWISSLVAVKKPGKLRTCIGPEDLNKTLKRNSVAGTIII